MKKKKWRTLDKVLLVLFIFLALFIVTMIVIFCVFRDTPDTLIQYVLGASGIELILTAWIRTTKDKIYKPHNTQTDDDTPPQEDPDGQADDY